MNRTARWRVGSALMFVALAGGRSEGAAQLVPGPGAQAAASPTQSAPGGNQNAAVPAASNDLQHVRFPERDADTPFAPPGTTVFLDAFPALNPEQRLLQRELLRQALLIAARDQMGLATCDRTLRDPFPEKRPTPPLMGVVQTAQSKALVITVFQEGETRPKALWEAAQPVEGELAMEALVAMAERLSRGELVEALTKAGYRSQVRSAPERSAAAVPDPINRLLDDLTFLAQYEAVRRLHAEISSAGESPALLSALARGYANLGAVTEYLWSAAHKALKARALLYAERLVARDEQSPEALFTRGYVRALVGRHAAALEDLDRARELAGRDGKAASRASEAPWVAAIDAFCRFDRRQQEQLAADKNLRPLIRYLQFLAYGNSVSERTRIRVADAVLEVVPECWQAAHLLCYSNILGVRRTATAQVFGRFPRTFYRRLKAVPDLPTEVADLCSRHSAAPDADDEEDADTPEDAAAEAADRLKVMQSLRQAAAAGEPSFGLLAHLVEETGFMHVRALLAVERVLAVPRDESLATFRPLCAEHRFADYIEHCATNSRAADVLGRVWKGIEAWQADLEYTALPMIRATSTKEPERSRALQNTYVARIDPVFGDLTGSMRAAATAQMGAGWVPLVVDTRRLPEISPHSPQAMVARINTDWQSLEKQARELEERYADEPQVLEAIANRYRAPERRDDLIRCLKLAIKASPEYSTYSRLAAVYRAGGNLEEWRATLDEYLQQDDAPGLQHARVQVDIADLLMNRGEYKQALPYADAAAESYAQWALACACRCHDLLEDWEQAEAYIRAAALRYESARIDWLEWCRRRGRGNVDAARRLAAQWVASVGDQPDPKKMLSVVGYYLLIDDNERALKSLEALFGASGHVLTGLHAALVADDLGQTDQRDRILRQIADSPAGKASNPIGPVVLARLMQDGFSSKDGPKFDVDGLDKLMQSVAVNPALATDSQYLAGRLLLKYGPREKGIEYLRQSATSPAVMFNRTMAAIVLRHESVEIGPTRQKE